MASDWFEQDNFRRTTQDVLIIALKERGIEFYELDSVVQTTLLGETRQVGVQQAMEVYFRMKATLEEQAVSKTFENMVLKEIYRERSKALPKDEQS